MGKQYTCIAAIIFLVLFSPALSLGGETVLYDADENQLPSVQPWLSYYSLFGNATQLLVDNGVRLSTTSTIRAGYSNHTGIPEALKNPEFPTLDRQKGFELHFQLQVHSEAHVSNDRAGFSVILLSDDNKGVELAFWEDEIWAQTDTPALFTHGESAALDTTTGLIDYRVVLQNDTYTLYQNQTSLLSGGLKDYSAFNASPYILSNFLFLGDNTSSAQADVTLGTVTITTNTLFPWHMFLPAMRAWDQDQE